MWTGNSVNQVDNRLLWPYHVSDFLQRSLRMPCSVIQGTKTSFCSGKEHAFLFAQQHHQNLLRHSLSNDEAMPPIEWLKT